MFKRLTLLLIAFHLFSCSYFNKKEESIDNREPIAKVNNVYLYKEDLESVLPENYKKNDSIFITRNYINTWAKKQILLNKAQLNLVSEREDIKKLVKKYKEDLLINKYREAVVNQNLDTIVSEADIDTFYVKNKETLKLNEKLLQLKFIHFSNELLDKKALYKLFKSDKPEDIETIMERELEFKSFYLNDSVWIKYSEVLKEIPLLEKEKLDNLKKSKFISLEDSLDTYIIKLNKVLKRNSISPKSYVKPTIKQMILHTRKLELLKEIERTLLNDANKNGQYEIYK